MTKNFYSFKLVLVFALLLGSIFFSHLPPVRFVSAVAAEIVMPILRLGAPFTERLRFAYVPEEIAAILKENQSLYAAKFESERIREENEELRRALGFSKSVNLELIGADVMLYSQELGDEFLLINQGESKDIARGDIAVTQDGMLVGRVREAGRKFSKIEIASNAGEKFAVRFLNPAMQAVARGIGARTFAIEFITPDALLIRGDIISLSHEKAPHHSVLIGTIVREPLSGGTALKEAKALLFARPELLDRVFIMKTRQ